MSHHFVLALIVLLLAPPAVAQAPSSGRLLGRVVDGATGAPLPQATVALYDADAAFVTGTAAGPDGAFALAITPGTYRVRVSFVGYASVEREDVAVGAGALVDLGEVRLAEDAALVGEAEVTAERELVEQRADRTVYNVAAQPVTAGGSALEALQTLPSVEVDTDGNLSLRGGQNVAVHLNGRPVPVRGAQLAALLRQIPASTVERVEVMPNPSARYEPDGMSGIINVVMKQGTSRGLSGGLTLGGGTAPTAEVSGNVAYQQGPWDAYASYGYRYDAFGLDGLSTRVRLLDAGDVTVNQDFALDNGIVSHLLTGTADYALAEGTTLGFSGTLGLRDGEADQDVAYVFEPGTPGESRSTRRTDGAVAGLSADAALTFRRQRGEGHLLSAEARYTRNDDGRDERFTDALVDPAGVEAYSRSDADDRVDEAAAQVDYARPLGGVRLEAGVKGTYRQVASARTFLRGPDAAAVPDPGLSGAFTYDEAVGAAYAQASRTLGAVELQAGLRVESAWRDVVPGFGEAPIEDRYTSLYPSAFALYTLGEGTSLKLSTSRRVNRPQAAFLNPTPRFQDTLIVDRGNPTLRPEYTTSVELALQYRYVLTATPFYRHTTDVIRRRIVFDPATGVTAGTFQNLDTADTYGLDLTLTPRLGPVRGVLAASAFRALTDGGSVETGLASDGFAWTLRGNLQAQLREGTDLQLFGFYRSPLETEDGRISGFGFATVGVSQQFGERFRLAVRANDVLGTAQFEFDTGDAAYTFHGLRDPALQQVSATLSYTFGQGAPRRPRPQPQQGGGLDGGIGF
jgi:outer membrane receptor protein involved in Fe transport